jgi:hypothetical protein
MDKLEEIKQAARNLLIAADDARGKFGHIGQVNLHSQDFVIAPLMSELGIIPLITVFDKTYTNPYQVNYYIDELHFFFLANAASLKKFGILGEFPENMPEYESSALAEERAKNAALESEIRRLKSKIIEDDE